MPEPPESPGPPGPTHAERGVLVGVDLRGIQAFIYEGRRLLDAVGRSAMVGDLVNTERTEDKRGKDTPGIVGLLRGEHEVLRDTGGALWVAFTGENAAANAREFTAHYTRRLRETSVRIQPVVTHLPYGEGEHWGTLAAAVDALSPRLDAERGGCGHTPVLGYGVTANCEVTGRPAETVDPSRGRETTEDGDAGETPPERVAKDVLRARQRGRTWHQEKNEEWLRGLRWSEDRDFDLPMDVEQLGRKLGEVSRQAVIHLDFNDLGKTLRAYAAKTQRGTPDYVTRMSELSGQVRELTEGLARAMSRAVAKALEPESEHDSDPVPVLRGSLPDQILRAALYQDRYGKKYVKVPLRPIVAGGDDLTIICDGRLSWSLTRFALDWLDRVDVGPKAPGEDDDPRRPFIELGENEDWDIERLVGGDEDTGVPPTKTGVPSMKIGIAVQPVGAPLIAGYRISDELATLAKKHRVKSGATGDRDQHAVAWSLDFDTPERVSSRLQHRAAGNGDPLTAQPMLGSDFRDFLRDYFATNRRTSLRGATWRENRSWLIGDLAKLLEQGHDLGAELERRQSLELPHEMPEPADDQEARARLYEALDLIDLHLDVDLKEVP